MCVDCHQEAVPGAIVQTAGMSPDQVSMTPERKSLSPEMVPVTYEKDCKGCHPLAFDTRFPAPAPHKETKIVEDYAGDNHADYIAKHPNEVREPVVIERGPALPALFRHPPANAAQWIAQRTEEADRLFFQKDCKECQCTDLSGAPSSLPDVPKANETVKWMKNAWFDHKPHQTEWPAPNVTPEAPNSQKTEDVLLPGIATCQKCHTDSQNAASAACSECHVISRLVEGEAHQNGQHDLSDFKVN